MFKKNLMWSLAMTLILVMGACANEPKKDEKPARVAITDADFQGSWKGNIFKWDETTVKVETPNNISLTNDNAFNGGIKCIKATYELKAGAVLAIKSPKGYTDTNCSTGEKDLSSNFPPDFDYNYIAGTPKKIDFGESQIIVKQ